MIRFIVMKWNMKHIQGLKYLSSSFFILTFLVVSRVSELVCLCTQSRHRGKYNGQRLKKIESENIVRLKPKEHINLKNT